MKVIIWHKTNFHKEDEVNVYSLEGKTDKEMSDALRSLWEKELNTPEYDIDAHRDETYFEETSARVTNYDWYIDMWIDEVKEAIE